MNIVDFEAFMQSLINNREAFISKTAKILSDQPSDKGWKPSEIKKTFYEPDIIVYDMLTETAKFVLEIAKDDNKIGLYQIDLSSYLIASSIPNEFKLVGNVNEEVIETIKEYLETKIFKNLVLTLNNQIKMVHTIVEENENNYFLRGVGIKESSVQGANLEIIINKVSKEITGTVSFSANFKDLSSEISKMKDDLLKFCDKKYVPKQDMQTLNPNGLDYAYVDKNGDIKQGKALTVGGVIKVNTYDLEDYSIGGN